jgi:hypothetical protein
MRLMLFASLIDHVRFKKAFAGKLFFGRSLTAPKEWRQQIRRH